MTRLFVYTEAFKRSWKLMGLNDDDATLLEKDILKDPAAGDVIEGTGEAWECGKANPSPTAKKLMFLIREDHSLADKL